MQEYAKEFPEVKEPLEVVTDPLSMDFYQQAAADIGGVNIALAPRQVYGDERPLPEGKVRVAVNNLDSKNDLSKFWNRVKELQAAAKPDQQA